ncbi:hypothetical protein, conserved [Trypanosoma brucei gambiense DAL972]|uniref:Uncharacterized protein n=2 Tax=Trypanosoma brucei TaxID=5691 RepID=C9ZY74_TRYB9|nr:hypothetical protein, conserved [Trypanosoma brucei gambiense DAL972]CBH14373.1 hypothetical protein, conserved [Trypanosoma brucei gambiense DAL972]|eukprot:XP_011776639.1 hypothetical protein, conserved [Trypanosoma brucei gambiense DAL972]
MCNHQQPDPHFPSSVISSIPSIFYLLKELVTSVVEAHMSGTPTRKNLVASGASSARRAAHSGVNQTTEHRRSSIKTDGKRSTPSKGSHIGNERKSNRSNSGDRKSNRSNSGDRKSNRRNPTPEPNGSLENMSTSQLLSRLLCNTRLEDMRPDAYRLDMTQKEDVRYLYEMQHRVDPELNPFRARANTAKINQMNKSRIFDFTSPTPPVRKQPAVKHDDGLGSLARFIYSQEGRRKTTPLGRRPNTVAQRRATFHPFRPDEQEYNPITPGRRVRYQLSTYRWDNLGGNLVVKERSSAATTPRPCIRTRKGVDAFEATQPVHTLPPRKRPPRVTESMQGHPGYLDHDIFGIRSRRKEATQRCRSLSPFLVGRTDLDVRRTAVSQSATPLYSPRNNYPAAAGVTSTPNRRHCTTPFGDESPAEVGPRGLSSSREPIHFSEGEDNRDGCQCVCTANTPTKGDISATSAPGGGDNFYDPAGVLVSPRIRSGVGRVAGQHVTKSNIVFGETYQPQTPSPRRVSYHTSHLNSTQVRDLLVWT